MLTPEDANHSFGDVTVLNAGRMIGDVQLGQGADRIVNTGSIHGDLDLGQGADLYDGAHGILRGMVFGGDGDDTLIGGGRSEVLIGGAGADELTGGGQADVFRYDSLSDSTPGHPDLIADYTARDRLDFSRIDADPSTPGDQAFVHGELTLTFDPASGKTWLQIDAGLDGSIDLKIVIAGDHHTDFSHIML